MITGNATALTTDNYIGAQLTAAATLKLPEHPDDCINYIIKLEFGAPVGTRKLTILPTGNTIDGNASIVMTNPYESISIISRGGQWWELNRFV